MSGSLGDREEERWKVLDNQIVVTVKDETYRFRIPNMLEYSAIGSRAAAIRRGQDPMRVGNISSLDMETADAIWGFAAFEVLLDKTSVEWPVSKDEKGAPVIDSSKFPLDRWNDMMEVVYALDAALRRFRSGGFAVGQPDAAKAVDGGKGPGTQKPVSP